VLYQRHILNTLTSLLYDIFSKLKSKKKKKIGLPWRHIISSKNQVLIIFLRYFFFEYEITIISQLWIKSMKFKC